MGQRALSIFRPFSGTGCGSSVQSDSSGDSRYSAADAADSGCYSAGGCSARFSGQTSEITSFIKFEGSMNEKNKSYTRIIALSPCALRNFLIEFHR